ncbi:MAG TPA: single-stranded DNA-binding protein [Pseudonocardiaceae bacterium]|jgi:single-strand DNA-binding protein|nr:single-stranded DNA-binding protein [Pseudonocardiaceae bacterium]
MNETPVTVVGTLVSEMRARRVGPEGRLVLNFRVASNERRFDKVSGSWVDGESLYLPVSCWRSLAENAASLVKGDPVIVSGKLRTREWTTEAGVRRSVIEMEASALGPDLARCSATVHKRRREEPASTEREPAEEWDEESDPDGTGGLAEGSRLAEGSQVAEGGRADEGRLSELAEAARPLVPMSV